MSSDFVIRPYQSQDEAQVVSLWTLCFPDDPPWNEPRDVIRTKLTVQPELFLVALKEERLIGTVLAGFDGFRGWVNKVATHPDCQRLGVASKLMKQAEVALARLGCRKLNLQIRSGNDAVASFYAGLGFEPEARISMGKRLDPIE